MKAISIESSVFRKSCLNFFLKCIFYTSFFSLLCWTNIVYGQNSIQPDINNTLYVDINVDTESGGYTGDGSSWGNAIPQLATLLQWAQTNKNNNIWDGENPLKVFVAIGEYKPSIYPVTNQYSNSRDVTFLMVKNVQIYGGFDPKSGITTLNNKRIILDSGGQGSILKGEAPNGSSVHHVVLSVGDTEEALLDGFTITGGLADGPAWLYQPVNNSQHWIYQNFGAGIYNLESSASYANLKVTGNDANGFGGGIYNDRSSPQFSNVIILENSSNAAPGMFNDNNSNPTLKNVAITDNIALYDGPGIKSTALYNRSSSRPRLKNVTIAGNTVPESISTLIAAATSDASSSMIVHNSIILGEINNFNQSQDDIFLNSLYSGADTEGTGNIDADGYASEDIFNDHRNGDYTPSPLTPSPAVNAGNNSLYPGNLQDDLDPAGNNRLYGNAIDMGAYEFIGNIEYRGPDDDHIFYVNQNVDKNAPGYMATGSSWNHAIPDLGYALLWARREVEMGRAAWNNENPLQIWVAAGNYKPQYHAASPYDKNNVLPEEEQAFIMVPNVQLYGGFDPENGVVALNNDRILPGSGKQGTVLDGNLPNEESVYHVLLSAGDVGAASLDGFTITGGAAYGYFGYEVNGFEISGRNGGGIFLIESSPVFTNIAVQENNSSMFGGGIYMHKSSTVITNAIIDGNTATDRGGGIYVTESSPAFTYVTIKNNETRVIEGRGGGIYHGDGSDPKLTNVIIKENRSGYGAGMTNNQSSPLLTNVAIIDNTANFQAGAISSANSGNPKLINVTIAGNTASSFDAIDTHTGSALTIRNSIVWGQNRGTNHFSHSIFSGTNTESNGNIHAEHFSMTDVFTDPENDDYSLLNNTTNPALDSGSNQAYVDGGGDLSNDTDLAGNPRVYDYANDGIIDMGAYEFQGEPVAPINVTLALDEGWRMLTSPKTGQTYAGMLSSLWTQGAEGANYGAGTPNVYTWPANQTGTDADLWVPVDDLTHEIPAGSGFLMYVYNDDEYGTHQEEPFPKTISLAPPFYSGEITPPMNTEPGGWTLLGNPYSQPVAFNELSLSGIENAAYVYDPNGNVPSQEDPGPTGDNGGAWVSTVEGVYGDLADGILAPGQGFFVQNQIDATHSQLTFTSGAIAEGGRFYGKKATARNYIRLDMRGESLYNSVWIRFSEAGSEVSTQGEAQKLQPLSEEYAILGVRKADGQLKDVAHYPSSTETTLEIPLTVQTTQAGSYTLRVTDLDLPAGLELYLQDRHLGKTIPLTTAAEYSFTMDASEVYKEIETGGQMNPLAAMIPPARGTSRFVLTGTEYLVDEELPSQTALHQNYPNPFNPATIISYELPATGQVRLDVYDMAGRQVATLVNTQMNAGRHQVIFNGANLSSGVYMCRLQAGGQTLTRKLTILK